jgi:hypothetical protein
LNREEAGPWSIFIGGKKFKKEKRWNLLPTVEDICDWVGTRTLEWNGKRVSPAIIRERTSLSKKPLLKYQ